MYKPSRQEWQEIAKGFMMPITEEGQLCRHCETPVKRRTHREMPPKRKRKGKALYWFEWWFKCPNPKCGAQYMVEAAKRFY